MPAALTNDAPFYIVLNAGSGSGDARSARSQMEEVLNAADRPHEFLFARRPGELPDLARQAATLAARNHGAVIAAGGDGTINAAAQAALPAGLPFGIVPRGTFNYSSRAHGVPLDVEAATRALLDARLTPTPVGLINDRAFLVNASLGLYRQALQDRERFKRQYGRKRIVAIGAALITLARERQRLVLDIEHDGERELVRTPTLFVGVNPLQLEQVGLPEAQDVQRRRLAAVIIDPVGTAKLLWLGLCGAFGRLGDASDVRDFAFDEMIVRPLRSDPRRGVKIATDGEIVWMQPPLHFRIAPQPLLLMTPA